jgi:hypothetical protein
MKPPPALPANTVRWLILLLCGAAGCQTAPTIAEKPVTTAPATLRLCGHQVPAKRSAVEAEILRHVAPGLPVEAARTRMEELGFACLYAGVLHEKPAVYRPAPTAVNLPELLGIQAPDPSRLRRWNSLVCTRSVNEFGTWGHFYFPLTVLLPYDEEGRVTGVEVDRFLPELSRHAEFFARRPELREPIGLPVEQARAVMEAHRFCCADVRPQKPSDGPRPYLDCRAYDETPLGGQIVRVHLYYDAAGQVTEAEVIQKVGSFDGLLCMLPNGSDTLAGGVVKAAVFPVRLGTLLMLSSVVPRPGRCPR